MALRVQNNISAINAHKNLAASDAAMAKSLERLSSGYRINRAADDAAGLSISSSFRANIASFKVASRNTTEANALLQVAEGGMEQIENMLTRLKELATQAGSANVGTTERTKINAEGNQLIAEIDRIANSTKYGSTALLDGTFGAAKAAGTMSYQSAADATGQYGSMTHVYSATGAGVALFSANFISSLNTANAYTGSWTVSVTATTMTLIGGNLTETLAVTAMSTVAAAKTTYAFAGAGITFQLNTYSTNGLTTVIGGNTEFTIKETGLTDLSVTNAASGTYTFSVDANAGSLTLTHGSVSETENGITFGASNAINFNSLGVTFNLGAKYTENDLENLSFVVSSSGSGGNVFQIGVENNTNNQISLTIGDVRTSGLNSGLLVDHLDTQTEAQSMLTTIDSAISALASSRGTIGASMNRLSYAAANLATTIENTQAAESVIRDVDMADEMTSFTKNQILVQAGTAMLAQANQSPQLILSLLK